MLIVEVIKSKSVDWDNISKKKQIQYLKTAFPQFQQVEDNTFWKTVLNNSKSGSSDKCQDIIKDDYEDFRSNYLINMVIRKKYL